MQYHYTHPGLRVIFSHAAGTRYPHYSYSGKSTTYTWESVRRDKLMQWEKHELRDIYICVCSKWGRHLEVKTRIGMSRGSVPETTLSCHSTFIHITN